MSSYHCGQSTPRSVHPEEQHLSTSPGPTRFSQADPSCLLHLRASNLAYPWPTQNSLPDSYQQLAALLNKRRKLRPWSGLLTHTANLSSCQHRSRQQEVTLQAQSSPISKLMISKDSLKRMMCVLY